MKDCLLESANGLISSGRTFSKCLFIENYFAENYLVSFVGNEGIKYTCHMRINS